MAALGVYWWEAGLATEDRGGSCVKAVCEPEADSVPVGVHRLGGPMIGDQVGGPICQNGEKEAQGDAVG